MTLTLAKFTTVAAKNPLGEISLGKSGKAPRNEGVIGSKIANFVRTIGEALHIIARRPVHAERQEAASNAFRTVLTERYGGLADEALNQARGRRDANQVPMTGRFVLDVEKNVRGLITNLNEIALVVVLPRDPGEKVRAMVVNGSPIAGTIGQPLTPNNSIEIPSRFEKLAEKVGIDVSHFRGNGYLPCQADSKMTTLYKMKLDVEVRLNSRVGNLRVAISEKKMDELAEEVLKGLKHLLTGGKDVLTNLEKSNAVLDLNEKRELAQLKQNRSNSDQRLDKALDAQIAMTQLALDNFKHYSNR